MEIFQKKLILN